MSNKPKNIVLLAAALAAAGLPLRSAWADEWARVISSTPVMQQVAVPQQVCSERPVAVAPARSGGGAVVGAIAGAAIGNAIGGGMGRAAATLLGGLGGAVLGDQIEGRGAAQVQNVTECSTQTVYENRPVAWNVVYEYNGRQYQTQMPNDPGPTLRLQVTPVAAAPAAAYSPPGALWGNSQTYGQSDPAAQTVQPQYAAATSAPVYTAPVYAAPVVAAPPVYSAPVYPAVPAAPAAYVAPSSWVVPVGVSLGLGYIMGRSAHGHSPHHPYRGWR